MKTTGWGRRLSRTGRVAWGAGLVLAMVWGCSSDPEDEQSVDPAGSGGGSTSGGDGDHGGSSGATADDGMTTDAESSGGNRGEGCIVFPKESEWNRDVSTLPVHEQSDDYVAAIGATATMHPDFGTVWDGAPIGIPFILVDETTEMTPIEYTAYGPESDPGPFPIPLDAPIEGGPSSSGDRHVIALDTDACMLYELYAAYPGETAFSAASGAAYDLTQLDDHPEGCTSADAAGLPIYPGLVRYDEVVESGEITHALRFTVQRSQRAYIYPARHYASNDTDPNLPPMGLRLRMKADFDCSQRSSEAQVICTALMKYGMFVADNGSNWYLSGAPDSRWDDDALGDLKSIPGSAFEVVDTGYPIVTDAPDCVID